MTNAVEDISTTAIEVGRSARDRRIAAQLAHHAVDEAHVIESYRWLLEQPLAPAVRYLVHLIVEDEERHHRLLLDMARSVASGPLADQNDDMFPSSNVQAAESLDDLTDSFLAVERNDRAELRRLVHDLRPVVDTSPLALLADVMLLDTEKHIRILHFIKRLNNLSR